MSSEQVLYKINEWRMYILYYTHGPFSFVDITVEQQSRIPMIKATPFRMQ